MIHFLFLHQKLLQTKRPCYLYLCVTCIKKETLTRKMTFFPQKGIARVSSCLKPGSELERRPDRDKTVDRLDAAVEEHDIVYTRAEGSLQENIKLTWL